MSHRVRRPTVAAAVSGLGLVLGLAAESVAFRWDDPRSWVPDLVVGWVLVTAGSVAWARGTVPRAASLLTVLAGAAWWCGNLEGVGLPWLSWAAGQLTFLHRALLVHAVLAGLGALRRNDGLALMVAAYVLTTPRLASEPVASVLLSLGMAAVVVRRRPAVPGAAFPAGRHVRVAGLVLAATFLLTAVEGLVDGSGDAWLLAYEGGLVASGLSLTLPWRRRTAGDVTDLVVRLGGDGGSLGSLLADVLGDPHVRLVELREDDPDLDGPSRQDGCVATPVRTHAQGTTYLVHRQSLVEDPALMASVVRAMSLLLDHERLQGDLRRRVGEVAESRARLLRVADEESARLRDRIHQGAGARMDAVVAGLRGVIHRDAAPGERDEKVLALAATAEARARRVRQDLADLEHALLPDLESTPLATVLENLADASPTTVTLTVDDGLDAPPEVAAVVWFVCAEGLTNVARHAGATRAEVAVTTHRGRLRVTVEDDGAGAAGGPVGAGLRNLRDRVEAIGGELRLTGGDGGGTMLAAELPLDGQHAATSDGSRELR